MVCVICHGMCVVMVCVMCHGMCERVCYLRYLALATVRRPAQKQPQTCNYPEARIIIETRVMPVVVVGVVVVVRVIMRVMRLVAVAVTATTVVMRVSRRVVATETPPGGLGLGLGVQGRAGGPLARDQ